MTIPVASLVWSAVGLCVTLYGLWLVVPKVKLPSFVRQESGEARFMSDLALVLRLQSRLTDAGNVAAARLCDQIKLEMLKPVVPVPREPERRPL